MSDIKWVFKWTPARVIKRPPTVVLQWMLGPSVSIPRYWYECADQDRIEGLARNLLRGESVEAPMITFHHGEVQCYQGRDAALAAWLAGLPRMPVGVKDGREP
jgi:hypothetical protein